MQTSPVQTQPLYTPLVLQYVQPLRGEWVSSNRPLYTLEITAPDSALPGVCQTLPETQRLVVPSSGWLRLELVPSTLYVPNGYYRVRYFQFHNRLPCLTQHWWVPIYRQQVQITVTRSQSLEDELPLDIFQVLQVSAPGQWELVANRLHWISGAPPAGSQYQLLYLRGLTLHELMPRRAHSMLVPKP